MSNNTGRPVCCSFCGKPQEEADKIIAGPGTSGLLLLHVNFGISLSNSTNIEGTFFFWHCV